MHKINYVIAPILVLQLSCGGEKAPEMNVPPSLSGPESPQGGDETPTDIHGNGRQENFFCQRLSEQESSQVADKVYFYRGVSHDLSRFDASQIKTTCQRSGFDRVCELLDFDATLPVDFSFLEIDSEASLSAYFRKNSVSEKGEREDNGESKNEDVETIPGNISPCQHIAVPKFLECSSIDQEGLDQLQDFLDVYRVSLAPFARPINSCGDWAARQLVELHAQGCMGKQSLDSKILQAASIDSLAQLELFFKHITALFD